MSPAPNKPPDRAGQTGKFDGDVVVAAAGLYEGNAQVAWIEPSALDLPDRRRALLPTVTARRGSPRDIRLIETEVSVAVFAVAFERPDGLAPYPPADRISIAVWLYIEVPACRASPRRGSKEGRAPAP